MKKRLDYKNICTIIDIDEKNKYRTIAKSLALNMII